MATGRWIAFLTIVGAIGLAPTGSPAQQAGGSRIGPQDLFQRTNILSPGARDDWPLTLVDGEAVILSATSQAFDPAVELVGPAGQVVARNDDIATGRQDAQLLAQLTLGGNYRVRVVASNGATGGRYALTVRRLVATELPIGARSTATLGKSLARWHRFAAEAGRTLVVTARAAGFAPQVEVVGPDGETVAVGEAGPGPTRAVFRADREGVYYAKIAPSQGGGPVDSYAVTASIARALPTTIGAANPPGRIEAGGLDLWSFRGEPGDLVRVRVAATSGRMLGQLSHVPGPDPSTGEARAAEGQAPPFALLPGDPKSTGELVALLNVGGTFQVAASHPLGVAADYTLATDRPSRPLGPEADPGGSIAPGGADFRSIEGAPGQILRVEAASGQFDAELELFGPQGDLVARDDDGGPGRDAALTALLASKGRYTLRIHAHGDGGGGVYRLRRVADPVRPLAIDSAGEGSVGPGGAEVWSFPGRAGQTVILGARSGDFNVKLALYGPDAVEVGSDDDGGEGTDSLLSARLPVSGVYTVWVSSTGGGGRYSVQLIDAR